MDYDTNQPNSRYPDPNQPQTFGADGDGFARAAFTMGIIALIGCRVMFLPTILASIAIILAILSRGYRRNFSGKTRNAVIIAVVAIVLNIVLSVSSIGQLAQQMRTPQFQQQFNQIYENIYGVPYNGNFGFGEGETL